MGMDMDMGGAITEVAATTTVGIAVTTMGGGIIAIGGDFHLKTKKGLPWLAALFLLLSSIKPARSLVAIAGKPDIASSARFGRE
jgi:hypothetical protein